MSLIVVQEGACKKLGERLGASQPTVRRALRGANDTELARKIRYVAVKEFGGREFFSAEECRQGKFEL